MFWLGLTVAIAVLIAVREQHQKNLLVKKDHDEIALARGENEKAPRPAAGDSWVRATIQAAPEARAESALKKDEAKGITAGKKLGRAAQLSDDLVIAPKQVNVLERRDGANFAGSPPSQRRQELSASATPADATPLATMPPPPSPRHFGKVAGAAGKAAGFGAKSGPPASYTWYDASRLASIGPDVLLVFCDVSPEATKKKAFDKVLAANGIVASRPSELKYQGQKRGDDNDRVGNAKAPTEEMLEQRLARGTVVRRKAVAGNAELVYVEATPEQVKATLASLAAQPKLFVSVSVKTPQDVAARQLVSLFAMSGERPQANSSLPGLHGKADAEAQLPRDFSLPRAAAAKPSNAPATGRGTSPASQKDDMAAVGGRDTKKAEVTREPPVARSQRKHSDSAHGTNLAANAPGATPSTRAGSSLPPAKLGSQSEAGVATQGATPAGQPSGAAEADAVRRQQRGQPAPRQRVLFVVRIGGGTPPVASKAESQSGDHAQESAAPTPAEPSPAK